MKTFVGFNYHKTTKRFVAQYKDGQWDSGRMMRKSTVCLSEAACVIQYAQTCFEGLKAYRTKDGHIVCFRLDLNEQRLHDSCERMVIPPIPKEMFFEAVEKVVKANAKWIPSYESGGSLYLRPVVFGKDSVVGVKPAEEFEFRLFATPVGNYFADKVRPLVLRVSDVDRAAPRGTGHIKAGLNYAMSLYAITDAHEKGFDENLYLDPANRTYVEETGGANVLFITKDGTLVTPKSDSILPSITRRSIVTLAKDAGIHVEERRIAISELKDMKECGLCGTAAVISPVGKVKDTQEEYTFSMDDFDNTVLGGLRKKLLGIQHGDISDDHDWIIKVI